MENLDNILDKTLRRSGPFEFGFQPQFNHEGLMIYEIFVKDRRDGPRKKGVHSASIYPYCMTVELQDIYKKQFPKNLLLPFITRMEEEGYIIKE